MAEPFIGQIIAVGFNFTPVGWLACDGSLKPISEFTPLFSLIGTTYGGDGEETFAMPNLNGRAPLGVGQKPGGSNFVIGETVGTEDVTLLANQVGPHNHGLLASVSPGTTTTPGPGVALAANPQVAAFLYASVPATQPMSPRAIQPAGLNQPHENRQPYQVFNYIICAEGIFPSRS